MLKRVAMTKHNMQILVIFPYETMLHQLHYSICVMTTLYSNFIKAPCTITKFYFGSSVPQIFQGLHLPPGSSLPHLRFGPYVWPSSSGHLLGDIPGPRYTQRLTWNLKMDPRKRRYLLETHHFQVPAVSFSGVHPKEQTAVP